MSDALGSPRLKVPASVRRGEVFTVKSILAHPMESGLRKDEHGLLIPRRIVRQVTVSLDGQELMRADWNPGISANPYWEFALKADHSGSLVMEWQDDDGSLYRAEAAVTVVP